MNNFNYNQLVKSWYDTPQTNDDRIKLYEKTEDAIKFLEANKGQTQIKELCGELIKELGSHTPSENSKLSKWIAENTQVEEVGTPNLKNVVAYVIKDIGAWLFNTQKPEIPIKFDKLNGAYQHFHHLIETIAEVKGQPNPPALDKIEADILTNIDQVHKQANLSKLPKEILKASFLHLSTSELISLRNTSDQNRRLADDILIKRLNEGSINLRDLGIERLRDPIKFFGDRCSDITRIYLDKLYPSDSDIEMIANAFPNLEHLTIIESEMTNASSTYLAKMTALKSLSLINCCLDLTGSLIPHKEPLNDFTFLKELANLKSLNLSGSSAFKDASILKSCPNLTELNLKGCAVKDFSPLGTLKNLEKLDLEHTRPTNNDYDSVLSLCPHLKSLNLSYNTIGDFSIFQHCQELEHINLGHMEPGSPDNISSILLYCPDLKSIDLDKSRYPVEEVQALIDKGIEVRSST